MQTPFVVDIPWVPKVTFPGRMRARNSKKRKRKTVFRVCFFFSLHFLLASSLEKENLWHPGYGRHSKKRKWVLKAQYYSATEGVTTKTQQTFLANFHPRIKNLIHKFKKPARVKHVETVIIFLSNCTRTFFHEYGKNFSSGGFLRMRKQNTESAVPLDAVPERRTKRCSPRFRPGDRFWSQVSDTCRQALRERNVGP